MRLFIILFSLLIGFSSCKKDGTSLGNTEKTPRGYEFVMFDNDNGPVGVAGDEIYFDMEAVVGDSILYDSRKGPVPQRFVLPTEDKITAKSSPLLEVLPLMSEGDSLVLYVPFDSLPQKPEGFDDESIMAYRLYMDFILRQDPTAKSREVEIASLLVSSAKTLKENNIEEIRDLGNGLRMLVHDEGTGEAIGLGDRVVAHYYGVLADGGDEFDNSFKKGKPFTFSAGRGQVIRGWDQTVMALRGGSKVSIYVPSALGYGSRSNGGIPADSDLVFYIEIVE